MQGGVRPAAGGGGGGRRGSGRGGAEHAGAGLGGQDGLRGHRRQCRQAYARLVLIDIFVNELIYTINVVKPWTHL